MEKEALIEELRFYGIEERILGAFRKVPREMFISGIMKNQAYENHPLPIGHDQTISQPLMIADMTQRLELKEGDKVLEIGAGSGYQAAIIKALIGEKGEVISVERIPELVELAKGNLLKAGYDVDVVPGDGTLGYPAEAPYDRIIVTAAAPDVPPPLVEQLKVGGLLAIPVGGSSSQQLYIVKKVDENNTETSVCGGCIFVKLIGKYGWPE